MTIKRYEFQPYDILEVAGVPSGTWLDFSTIRDATDASYAARAVRTGVNPANPRTSSEFRIVRGRDRDVVYSRELVDDAYASTTIIPGPGEDGYALKDEESAAEALGYPPEHESFDRDDEPECDYCGQSGHTFRSCPKRDDVVDYSQEGEGR